MNRRIEKSAVFKNNVASENGGAIASPVYATFELPEDTIFEGNSVRYVSEPSLSRLRRLGGCGKHAGHYVISCTRQRNTSHNGSNVFFVKPFMTARVLKSKRLPSSSSENDIYICGLYVIRCTRSPSGRTFMFVKNNQRLL